MRKKKLAKYLDSTFGTPPDTIYFLEDMPNIRAYFEHRKQAQLDPFYIDDITWNDLSMDKVFQRINTAHSTSGEQHLYYTLRCPAVEKEEYEKRRFLLSSVEQQPDLRLKLQLLLYALGKRRGAYTSEVFSPSPHGSGRFWGTAMLVAGLVGSLAGMFFLPTVFGPLAALLLIGNPIYHFIMTRRLVGNLDAMQYAVALVRTGARIEALHASPLGDLLAPLYAAAHRTRSVARLGGVSFATQNDFAMLLNSLFLLDLITYERLKRRLGQHRQDLFILHEHIGRLDAAIAVASYRKSLDVFCDPSIDFSPDAKPALSIMALTHPLVEHPIPNDIETVQGLLVTGSNASGKSTFLKSIILNVMLAQSICTAVCARYAASSFRMYSSMAIADDLCAGESYFIAELKSLKRILHASASGERILCAIDEVLRGTNTVERIAASSELLRALAQKNLLPIAATHDGELCNMLAGVYRLVHFEERIEGSEVLFDYCLREGPATTRNAIRLLAALGYDSETVARATQKAEAYAQSGSWESPAPS